LQFVNESQNIAHNSLTLQMLD